MKPILVEPQNPNFINIGYLLNSVSIRNTAACLEDCLKDYLGPYIKLQSIMLFMVTKLWSFHRTEDIKVYQRRKSFLTSGS